MKSVLFEAEYSFWNCCALESSTRFAGVARFRHAASSRRLAVGHAAEFGVVIGLVNGINGQTRDAEAG